MHSNHLIQETTHGQRAAPSRLESTIRGWIWPAVIAASAVGAAYVYFAGVESPVRPVIALWFILVAPGGAFVPVLGVDDVAMEVALTVALSLVLDAIVTGAMVYAGEWSVDTGLGALVVLTLLGVALQLMRRLCAGHFRDATG
jgi:uncharacterized membrane protein